MFTVVSGPLLKLYLMLHAQHSIFVLHAQHSIFVLHAQHSIFVLHAQYSIFVLHAQHSIFGLFEGPRNLLFFSVAQLLHEVYLAFPVAITSKTHFMWNATS